MFLLRLMNGDFVVDDQIDVETSVARVFVLASVAGFLSLGGRLARLLRLRLPVQLDRLETHQLVVGSETHFSQFNTFFEYCLGVKNVFVVFPYRMMRKFKK